MIKLTCAKIRKDECNMTMWLKLTSIDCIQGWQVLAYERGILEFHICTEVVDIIT